MLTPRVRPLVSLTALLALSLTVAACASAPRAAPVAAERRALTVRFDNDARDYVHVYLIGERREWLLGRVEAGARATLRLPDAAAAADAGSLQLAVLAGARMMARVAGEPRAAFTIAQPAEMFVSQQWTFSNALDRGQLAPMARRRW